MGQLEIQDTFTPYFDPETEIGVTIRVERIEVRKLRATRQASPVGRSAAAEGISSRGQFETPPRI